MSAPRLPERRRIEVRGFKWPRRATGVSRTYLLGEDEHGRWLGIVKGEPWHLADGSRSGVFLDSFVKVVPDGTSWSACFKPTFPEIDVDIILPVTWRGDVLEEVDLELDILRSVDGVVRVRDRGEFERVRAAWAMPGEVATRALATCEAIRARVAAGAEPFGTVGPGWLARFLAEVEARPPDGGGRRSGKEGPG